MTDNMINMTDNMTHAADTSLDARSMEKVGAVHFLVLHTWIYNTPSASPRTASTDITYNERR
jgi:hypothetical protein